jgi:hypothetical protein
MATLEEVLKEANRVGTEASKKSGIPFKPITDFSLPDKPEAAPSIETPDVTKGISTSLPALDSVDTRKIQRETERQFASSRSALGQRFDQKIGAFKEEAAQQESALEGKLGTRRRFSSSAEAFIKFIDDKNQKQVSDLEAQKESALANFDSELAGLIDKRIATAQTQSQQEFNNAVTLFNLGQQVREEETAQKETLIQSEIDKLIVDAVDADITDLSEVFKYVEENASEDMGTVTLASVADSLATLMESTGSGSIEQLTGEAKNFYILKNIPGALPTGIDNVFDYLAAKKGAQTTPTINSSGKFTPGIPGISGETSTAISDAFSGLKFPTEGARKDAQASINEKLLKGDIDGAKALILQYAKNSFTSSQADVIIGYEKGIKSLRTIENGLKALEDAGIDTNIFEGIATKSLEKIGLADYKIAGAKIGDARLAELANTISLAIISFRKATSGNAFTESEGLEYKVSFPSIGKSKELNAAKIASLRTNFQESIDSYLEFRITGYDKLFKEGLAQTGVTTVPGAEYDKMSEPEARTSVINYATQYPDMQESVNEMLTDGYSYTDVLQVLESE